ncbi:hypothetical protein QOT17_022769 [Balamuthia mandrillaris]
MITLTRATSAAGRNHAMNSQHVRNFLPHTQGRHSDSQTHPPSLLVNPFSPRLDVRLDRLFAGQLRPEPRLDLLLQSASSLRSCTGVSADYFGKVIKGTGILCGLNCLSSEDLDRYPQQTRHSYPSINFSFLD